MFGDSGPGMVAHIFNHSFQEAEAETQNLSEFQVCQHDTLTLNLKKLKL